jgi:hypothetical protein
MLLYHGLKPATKDIDIIVNSEKEFRQIEKALKKLKFLGKIPTIEYRSFDLSQIFIRDDFRIDLFHKTVCKGFSLSSKMIKRAKQIAKLKYLTVSLCSMEDVFLFKTFTEREGDMADCFNIRERGIDWNVILDELEGQMKESGKSVWVTIVGERLQLFEERGMVVPIMPEIERLVLRFHDEFEKKRENTK